MSSLSIFKGIGVFVFLLIWSNFRAQTFVGWEDRNQPENNNGSINIQPSEETRMTNYLKGLDPVILSMNGGKQVFMLMPESVCGYCSDRCNSFWTEMCDSISQLNYIQAGRNLKLEIQSACNRVIHDPSSTHKRFGFDYAFPIIAFIDKAVVERVMVIEAEKIDDQLIEIQHFVIGP